MTINPVDMQVLIPQTGQVNKIQRALQNQQQTEQQILGQLIQEEMKKKEYVVQDMTHLEKKKIEDKNPGTKNEQHQGKKHRETPRTDEQSDNGDKQELAKNEFIGRNFDIKI